ncbi:MAG: enoyl-CoA hydratase-related protein [Dehalococcoidia bacterium]|nr:enoyl-CoA hydratase-related protein [Dehalococcoidia bacterium]
MADIVLVERDGPIATVTINRPTVLNALNGELLDALIATFEDLAAQPDCLVVLLTGSGDRAFIAGADIAAMSQMTPDEARVFMERGQRLCHQIENGPYVVIGAINGFALGGGCEVALACDLRIASERARIGLPEVTLGIMPAWGGTQRLPQIVGKGLAKLLIFTGEPIDAAEAYRIGLVNQVVPPDQVLPAARQLAERILRNGPLAVREAKRAIEIGLREGTTVGYQFEIDAETRLFATADRAEGMGAFVAKRPPRYQGA